MDKTFLSSRYKQRRRKRQIIPKTEVVLPPSLKHRIKACRSELPAQALARIKALYYSHIDIGITITHASGMAAIIEFIDIATKCHTWFIEFLAHIGLPQHLIVELNPIRDCHSTTQLVMRYKQRVYHILHTLLHG